MSEKEKNEKLDELKGQLRDAYKERTGKAPSTALDTLLDLLDENILQGYLESAKKQEQIHQNAIYNMNSKLRDAEWKLEGKINEANEVIRTAIEAKDEAEKAADIFTQITNEKMVNALRLYMAIVSIKFDSVELSKINLRNASYVVWAACMNGGPDDMVTPLSVFGLDNETPVEDSDDDEEFKPVVKPAKKYDFSPKKRKI